MFHYRDDAQSHAEQYIITSDEAELIVELKRYLADHKSRLGQQETSHMFRTIRLISTMEEGAPTDIGISFWAHTIDRISLMGNHIIITGRGEHHRD